MEYRQEKITLPSIREHLPDLTISAQIAEGTGLCYHAAGGNESYGWTITHLASKKALGNPIGTEHEVKLLMEKVIPITDWNQDEKALLNPNIAEEFKKCQQTVKQELNMQLHTAMQVCMPDYLVEYVMNEIQDGEYTILRNALLHAFKNC